MHVIDHQPFAWFLLRDDGELLLDVACEHGAVGYSVLVRLVSEERTACEAGGHDAVDRLARRIRDSAPGLAGSSSPWDERRVRDERAHAAIMAWQAAPRG
jgi:hypothetical protein